MRVGVPIQGSARFEVGQKLGKEEDVGKVVDFSGAFVFARELAIFDDGDANVENEKVDDRDLGDYSLGESADAVVVFQVDHHDLDDASEIMASNCGIS